MTWHDACIHLHLFQGRIIVHRDDQVNAILEILVDDLNRSGLSVNYCIESVSTPFLGAQAYTSPCLHLSTSNSYSFWRWVILAWKPWKIPTPTAYHAFSPSLIGRSSRIVPCIFMNCLGVRASVRSSISRVRSSCRICSFSSSLSVKMRKERISSISEPSKRAPGLSGAICG